MAAAWRLAVWVVKVMVVVVLVVVVVLLPIHLAAFMATTPHGQGPLFLARCRSLAAGALCVLHSLACAQALADRQRGRHCERVCVLQVHTLLWMHPCSQVCMLQVHTLPVLLT